MRTLILIVVVTAFAGCLNPLVMRRAETMKPGQIEILVAPELVLDTELLSKDRQPLGVAPSAAISGRIGLIDNLDLQLKLDAISLAELGIGYQVLGGHSPRDIKLTLTAGVGALPAGEAPEALSFLIFGAYVHMPVGVLVDIPIGKGHAIYAGSRLNTILTFGKSSNTILLDEDAPVFFSTMLNLGASFAFGHFVVQPEVGIDQVFSLEAGPGLTRFRFGLGLGGNFGG